MAGGGSIAGLGTYVSDWEQFVVAVERGYDFCSAEYDNDAWARISIDEYLAEAKHPVNPELLQRIEKADAKYLSLTRPRKRNVFELEIMNRVPIAPVGEMKEDIESLDL